MATRDGVLKATDFVFFCEEHALSALPQQFPRPQRKVMWTTLQLHFGNPAAHFEIQPQVARGRVELGLHFEGDVESNDRWAERVAQRAPQLMAELGDGWELEVWTASWRRLHRTFPFTKLTQELGREVGDELCKAIQVLGPLLIEASPLRTSVR